MLCVRGKGAKSSSSSWQRRPVRVRRSGAAFRAPFGSAVPLAGFVPSPWDTTKGIILQSSAAWPEPSSGPRGAVRAAWGCLRPHAEAERLQPRLPPRLARPAVPPWPAPQGRALGQGPAWSGVVPGQGQTRWGRGLLGLPSGQLVQGTGPGLGGRGAGGVVGTAGRRRRASLHPSLTGRELRTGFGSIARFEAPAACLAVTLPNGACAGLVLRVRTDPGCLPLLLGRAGSSLCRFSDPASEFSCTQLREQEMLRELLRVLSLCPRFLCVWLLAFLGAAAEAWSGRLLPEPGDT